MEIFYNIWYFIQSRFLHKSLSELLSFPATPISY